MFLSIKSVSCMLIINVFLPFISNIMLLILLLFISRAIRCPLPIISLALRSKSILPMVINGLNEVLLLLSESLFIEVAMIPLKRSYNSYIDSSSTFPVISFIDGNSTTLTLISLNWLHIITVQISNVNGIMVNPEKSILNKCCSYASLRFAEDIIVLKLFPAA
eukprot:NODE_237_length_13348_cov_0.297381.p6 type:complete len:163 gc:universal NODE_237_length_13348_cov_0.297381:4950-5438(+)